MNETRPPISRLETDVTAFVDRRLRLLAELEAAGGGALLLPTAFPQLHTRNSYYPFCFDSDFYYLTGFTEPDAWLLLRTHDEPRTILFCRPRNPTQEKWDGQRLGPERAKEELAFDAAYPIDQLETQLVELLASAPTLWAPLFEHEATDALLRRLKAALNRKIREGITAPEHWHDARALIARQRRIKSAWEIERMSQSAQIAAAAHRAAMQAAYPGITEAALEGVLLAAFRQGGAEGASYPPIVAGGENACILHYTENRAPIPDGALVLIDAGCKYRGYASDITRTFPVNGRFTGPQRTLYELVLAAQEAAIAATKPGASFDAPHEAACRTLVAGLIDLGVLQGDAAELIATKAYMRFYPHRTSHWLGLDVHDVGHYREQGKTVRLAPGMVLTIEPGLYFDPADDIPSHFWGIGIRIEDDVLVTDTGCQILSRDVPVAIEAIETLIAP